MGKNSKAREERRLIKLERQEQTEQTAVLRRRRKLIIGLVAGALALLIIAGTVLGVMAGNGFFRRRSVSMETPNFTVTDQMMCYYVYSLFQGYVNQYGQSAGITLETSMKKQFLEPDYSWFDHSSERAQANLHQILLFAEKAKEQGVTVSEEERQSIDQYLESVDMTAYQKVFSCTKEDLRQALELSSLATTMHSKLMEEIEITDQEITDYYKKNEKYFKKIDYKVIVFPYGENGWVESAESAKDAAEQLARAKTEVEYEEKATAILDMLGANDVDISNQLENAEYTNYYVEGDKFFEWAYADGRKTLETYVQEAETAYYVYQLMSLPARDDTHTVDVRHILLTADTYGSDDKAKAKAEELLNNWKKGAATDATFAALATSFTEDPGSQETGGLYTGVVTGEMVKEFDAWCFDAARQKGDTGIVKTTHGYHIMYFVDAGEPQWKTSAKSAVMSEKTVQLCEEYEKTWPITVHEKHIARLPL